MGIIYGRAITAGGGGFVAILTVTGDAGASVTATLGDKTVTGTIGSDGKTTLKLPKPGVWTVTTDPGRTVTIKIEDRYAVDGSSPRIYGVVWDGTSTTVWSRTDKAAGFENPNPYVAGATSYGSPFDDLLPWSGMTRVTDEIAGELVAIPKFWYRWTKSGDSLKLQIASEEVDGFYVSPAHADRGDGKGERDIVYIGRYHCADTYKSQSGVMPKASVTRSEARTSIHNLGNTIWQSDIQMRMTIWMLYLVEFADWNSQKTIGKGCGNNSATENMGYTDSMPYHTGTTLSSRDSYGLSTQYRHIEGLWDNVHDWGDGCYNNSNGFNIIMNPSAFSDTTGGTPVGVPTSGYPSAFTVATVPGLEWVIYPTAANGSETTYSTDLWRFNDSAPCSYLGGSYKQYESRGLFFVFYSTEVSSRADTGCRLQKLPS